MLFADVNMKRMGGVELIRFVRHEHPEVLSYLIVPSGEKNDFPFGIKITYIKGEIIMSLKIEKKRPIWIPLC